MEWNGTERSRMEIVLWMFEKLLGLSRTILDGFWTETWKLNKKYSENPILPLVPHSISYTYTYIHIYMHLHTHVCMPAAGSQQGRSRQGCSRHRRRWQQWDGPGPLPDPRHCWHAGCWHAGMCMQMHVCICTCILRVVLRMILRCAAQRCVALRCV